MFPARGCIVAAPSSLLATLPVGGACGLLVSLAMEGNTLPDRVIEGGAPCGSRLKRPRVGVPEPIDLQVTASLQSTMILTIDGKRAGNIVPQIVTEHRRLGCDYETEETRNVLFVRHNLKASFPFMQRIITAYT